MGRKNLVFLMAAALVTFMLASGAYAIVTDWVELSKQIKAKYAGFDKAASDITVTQKNSMVTPGGEMPSDMKIYRKGDKFRVENTIKMPGMPENMPPMENIVICDGKDTWMISSFMGKQKMPAYDRSQSDMSGNWWKDMSDSGKLVGSDKLDGRDCYVVEFDSSAKSVFAKIWIDKKSLILVQGEKNMFGNDKAVWKNSDFRKIEGDIEVPFVTEMSIGKNLVSKITVEKFEINKNINDDLFNPEKVEVKNAGMPPFMGGPMGGPGMGANGGPMAGQRMPPQGMGGKLPPELEKAMKEAEEKAKAANK